MEQMLILENELKAGGFCYIAGTDEAGRGPLAGRVYAAAVILPQQISFQYEINDSKKLSEKKRELAFEEIKEKSLAFAVSYIEAEEIDEINILNATHKAMRQAVDSLSIRPDYVLIDGNSMRGMELPHRTVIGGDAKSLSIAAASILAKVSRDRYMLEQALLYPQYEFEKHKGYGTKAHLELIAKYGPCPIHRKTFKGVREHV